MKKIFLASVFLFLSGCSPIDTSNQEMLVLHGPNDKTELTFDVEIADTDEERIQGLKNRPTLAADAGMLFVFPKEDILTFWMRDTQVSLDILYFDKDGKFINSFTMEPCTTEECPRYSSAALAKFALEVNKGIGNANAIGVGWFIDPAVVEDISNAE